MDINQLNNELDLTISNTEVLYRQALEVTDFEPDNNQISSLLASTFRTIRQNSGGHMDPYGIINSLPETKQTIIKIVKRLQDEANS